ncbi:hypothetical protein RHMOL_Rhmol10G0189400 [Rhododendron molle]|uniref:Uncharacterized protein n=1 Tax=Rhododendron molle TaxID=49168 RepID=A0ACC0M4Y7_RHOML|nr:hypothetical protein RHMOL_Rhmol10G0189400 [Rhododendron molle]
MPMEIHQLVLVANPKEIDDELTSQQGGIPQREHQCIIQEDFRIATSLPLSKEASPEGNTNASLRKIFEGTVLWPMEIHQLALASYLKEIDDKFTTQQ